MTGSCCVRAAGCPGIAGVGDRDTRGAKFCASEVANALQAIKTRLLKSLSLALTVVVFTPKIEAPRLVLLVNRERRFSQGLPKEAAIGSLGLRLPKSVAREVQLDEGDTVQVSVDNGTIVIRPSRPRYSLDDLVRRITPKNRHVESNWGGPLGDEVW